MKVKDLREALSKYDDEFTVYLNVDNKLIQLDTISPAQFYKTISINSRVDFDILRAEQTLLSTLQLDRDNLSGLLLDRIVRALGQSRVDSIVSAFDEFKKKEEEERELNKDLIEELENSMNLEYDGDMDEESAEKILRNYYKGGGGDINEVKEAKSILGEERSKKIFTESRS